MPSKPKKNPYQPTDRELDVLHFLREYRRNKERSPSLKEIQHAFYWKCIGTVQNHIRRLLKKGFVRKLPGYRGLIPCTIREQKTFLQNAKIHV